MFESVSAQQNFSKREMGSLSIITFKKNGKGLFLSSGLVDNYQIDNRQCFKVEFNEKDKQLRLTQTEEAHKTAKDFYVYTAKAGGRTKTGRPRLIIRLESLFLKLKIQPQKPVNIYPEISTNELDELVMILKCDRVIHE